MKTLKRNPRMGDAVIVINHLDGEKRGDNILENREYGTKSRLATVTGFVVYDKSMGGGKGISIQTVDGHQSHYPLEDVAVVKT